MRTVFNFSAGPSTLPEAVLEDVQRDLLSYKGSGVSVMEMSHRSPMFEQIYASLEERFRRLMHIPDTYELLFLQGGATLQFTMIPLNIAPNKRVAFIDTGEWSKKAIRDANHYVEVDVLASSVGEHYRSVPAVDAELTHDYLHITLNNTIEGTRYVDLPRVNVPLVADVSSNVLGEKIDVERFGLLYAGAQKNIGPAGLTVVIVRRDLIGEPSLPSYLDYRQHIKSKMLNTPTTFSLYVAERVLAWIEEQGGVTEMERRNREKSGLLYAYLDESPLFRAVVDSPNRSLTNIPFTTGHADLDRSFTAFAQERGLLELGGHRSVGGMRASLYNAMPIEGVRKLIDVMHQFEEAHRYVSHQNL